MTYVIEMKKGLVSKRTTIYDDWKAFETFIGSIIERHEVVVVGTNSMMYNEILICHLFQSNYRSAYHIQKVNLRPLEHEFSYFHYL